MKCSKCKKETNKLVTEAQFFNNETGEVVLQWVFKRTPVCLICETDYRIKKIEKQPKGCELFRVIVEQTELPFDDNEKDKS